LEGWEKKKKGKEKGKEKKKKKKKKNHTLNGGLGSQNLNLVLQLESLLYRCEEIMERGEEIH
jgi:hypothetical protein